MDAFDAKQLDAALFDEMAELTELSQSQLALIGGGVGEVVFH